MNKTARQGDGPFVLRPVIRKKLDEDIIEELSDIPSSDEMSPLRWHGNTKINPKA